MSLMTYQNVLDILRQFPRPTTSYFSKSDKPLTLGAFTPGPSYNLMHTNAEILKALTEGGCGNLPGDIVDSVSCWMSVCQQWSVRLDAAGRTLLNLAKNFASIQPAPVTGVDDQTMSRNKLLNYVTADAVRKFGSGGQLLINRSAEDATNAKQITSLLLTERTNFKGWTEIANDATKPQADRDNAQRQANITADSIRETIDRMALPLVDLVMSDLEYSTQLQTYADTVNAARSQAATAYLAAAQKALAGWDKTLKVWQGQLQFGDALKSLGYGLLGAPFEYVGKGIGMAIAALGSGLGKGANAAGKGVGKALLWLIPGVVIIGGVVWGISRLVKNAEHEPSHA